MKKRLLALLLLPLLVGSCSKSDSNNSTPSTGPKEYQVTYNVTAVNYTKARIIYRDAVGTLTTEEDVPLPKTYSFKRTMKSADVVSCGAFPAGGDASASVTCVIQINGNTVDTKSETGPNPQPVANYLIP